MVVVLTVRRATGERRTQAPDAMRAGRFEPILRLNLAHDGDVPGGKLDHIGRDGPPEDVHRERLDVIVDEEAALTETESVRPQLPRRWLCVQPANEVEFCNDKSDRQTDARTHAATVVDPLSVAPRLDEVAAQL